ncbi:MAG: cysteine rich repeat-containing protein [Gammaproteobacteria bacterium]|nr:cysteine rich repeat-containing protein [Gammaproteobacteria bacterium]
MKRSVTVVVMSSVLFAAACMAAPIEPIVETVAQGCEKELQSYCAKVTPGKGRVLACLYAHEDKLSGRCEYALYDAAAQL